MVHLVHNTIKKVIAKCNILRQQFTQTLLTMFLRMPMSVMCQK